MKNIKKRIRSFLYKIKNPNSYVSCKWLEHGIIFDHCNIIRTCCAQSHEGEGRFILKDKFHGEVFDWEEIFKQKKEQRAIQKSGKNIPSCKGCDQLELRNWDNEDYINMLLLTHWTKCNSECIYCPAIRDKEVIQINKHYDIIPTIKNMIEKGILKKDSFISIAGGESTIYPEFEELLNLLLDEGFSDIIINTSGIKYSEAIEKGLAMQKVNLLVSLDAGTKETHKKIKLVDSFDKTIKNLKKYVKAQNKELGTQKKDKFYSNYKIIKILKRIKHYLFNDYKKDLRVATKYIICPGINDNIEEIKNWLILNKELKIKRATLDVEINWYKQNHENIPVSLKKLIKKTIKLSKNYNIKLQLIERAYFINE